MPQSFLKDPDSVLWYEVDWTAWLNGDTIATSAWVVPSGLTNEADTASSTSANIKVSGGTVGTDYNLVNRITTTTNAETVDRTITIRVRAR